MIFLCYLILGRVILTYHVALIFSMIVGHYQLLILKMHIKPDQYGYQCNRIPILYQNLW